MPVFRPFPSLVLFFLLAGCAIKEGPDSARIPDSLFDTQEPSASNQALAAGEKEPSEKDMKASAIDLESPVSALNPEES